MPTITRIGNIAIRVFFDDTKKHKRPHLHAVGPEDNMIVGLPRLDVIEGDLAVKDRAGVLEWASVNLDRLTADWNRCNPTMPVRFP